MCKNTSAKSNPTTGVPAKANNAGMRLTHEQNIQNQPEPFRSILQQHDQRRAATPRRERVPQHQKEHYDMHRYEQSANIAYGRIYKAVGKDPSVSGDPKLSEEIKDKRKHHGEMANFHRDSADAMVRPA